MLTEADEQTLREGLCAAAAVRISQLLGELHSAREVTALLRADVDVKLAVRPYAQARKEVGSWLASSAVGSFPVLGTAVDSLARDERRRRRIANAVDEAERDYLALFAPSPMHQDTQRMFADALDARTEREVSRNRSAAGICAGVGVLLMCVAALLYTLGIVSLAVGAVSAVGVGVGAVWSYRNRDYYDHL